MIQCCYCDGAMGDDENLVGAGTGDSDRFCHTHCHRVMEGENDFIGAGSVQQIELKQTRKYRERLEQADQSFALTRTLDIAENVLNLLSKNPSGAHIREARAMIQEGIYWARDWDIVQRSAIPK